MTGFDIATAAAAHGVIVRPGSALPPGRWTRHPTADKPHSRNGAVLLLDNGAALVQDHATMASPALVRLDGGTMPRPAIARAILDARQREQDAAYAVAADRARSIWRDASPSCGDHGYIAAKRLSGAHGARQIDDKLVLAFAIDGGLATLQFIGADGSKRFLRGGKKRGAYVSIGPRPTSQIVVSEGWATGASIHEATELPVAAAGDAGNLAPVARHMRNRFPEFQIIIAADHDLSGAGLAAAEAAARAVGGVVCMPPAPGDWNDHTTRHGLTAVSRAFEGFAR